MNPLLGWIPPQMRTQEQQDEHLRACARMPKFAVVGGRTELNKGEMVDLTNSLKAPEVVADIGYVFSWFHQLTGSCVGASLGSMLTFLSCTQRLVADTPTKAFVPWWPYSYGMTRADEGDRGQGEGAIDSVAVERLKKGVLDSNEPGLPKYSVGDDGIMLTSSMEMQWSDGNSNLVKQWESKAKFPLGTAALCNSVLDIRTGIINGYPNLNGCSLYVGNGSVRGSGNTAYVAGRYDGRGGHSTGIVAVWNHPNDGYLYKYQNNWPKSTYPADPVSGDQRCQVWITESELSKALSSYDMHGETFCLSHLNYFPAQPKVVEVLSWLM
jgi:hypothetical protein